MYEKLTDAKIAKNLHVTEATVRRWRRKYLIESRPRGPITTGGFSKISDDQIRNAVPGSYSVSEVLRKVGLVEAGSAHPRMRDRILALQIDINHFGTRRNNVLGHGGRPKPLEHFLRRDFRCCSSALRQRLISKGLLIEICSVCGLGPLWSDKRLVLQLDHIDGDNSNNLLNNLRILCPNCHTQTITFTSRNRNKLRVAKAM